MRSSPFAVNDHVSRDAPPLSLRSSVDLDRWPTTGSSASASPVELAGCA